MSAHHADRPYLAIARKALGKRLPYGVVVHHVDGNNQNNVNSNLVICPNRAYHNMLHARERALDTCGHADWLKCQFCKQYDAPLSIIKTKNMQFHRECLSNYNRKRRAKS